MKIWMYRGGGTNTFVRVSLCLESEAEWSGSGVKTSLGKSSWDKLFQVISVEKQLK